MLGLLLCKTALQIFAAQGHLSGLGGPFGSDMFLA